MNFKSFFQNIFSIKNEGPRKVIKIFGIKIKFIILKKIIQDLCIANKELYYQQKSNIEASVVHPQVFRKYENIYTNKTAVIVACGPSVKYYEPIKDAIHIGVNRAFLNDKVELDYLFIGDMFPDEENLYLADEYRKGECQKFYARTPVNLQKTFKPSGVSKEHIINANANQFIVRDSWGSDWPINILYEPFGAKNSSVHCVLQFLLFTNIKKIYLVGCDCSDKGHFHKEFYENSTTDLSYQYYDYVSFKEFITREYSNVEIISINPLGLKGLFKDVYTQSYVDEHPELSNEKVEVLK